VEPWLRGSVLGGSTAVNGMMYVRGQQEDYDALAAAGNPQWSWTNILPAFLAMEDHSLGASAMRGTGGPLGVTVPTDTDDETVRLFLDSAAGADWKFVEDRKSTRLNSSHVKISYAVFCLKKKTNQT